MLRAVAVLMLAAAAGLLWSRRAGAVAMVAGDAGEVWTEVEIQQEPATSFFDVVSSYVPETIANFGGYSEQVRTVNESEAAANLAAFLMMIRTAEGTADADGYRRMFGGTLFDSFADHPRVTNRATFKNGKTVSSTAAGAYQFLARTWDGAAAALRLPDFSPASQDAAAVYLIRKRGALEDVEQGRFAEAVRKCAKEWASLPGSTYGQPTISETRAREIYASAGGVFA